MLTAEKGNLLSNMSYVDLDEHLESIVNVTGRSREAVDIRLALSQFPELVGHRHYTGEVLLCSTSLNPYCDDILIQRYGREFVALPFTYDKNVRLHANPVVFYIGLDNEHGFGIVPYKGWDDHFTAHGLDGKIVAKVRRFLNSHAPANYL